MRIKNETHWRSDHLRKFVRRVALDELDSARRRRFLVEVTYNRGLGKGGGCSGWAPYHGSMIRVMVPSDTVDRVDLAHCIAHEMAHSRGMRHARMRGVRRYDRGAEGWRDYYAWAEALPLERKVPRPRPTRLERLNAKLVNALEQQRRWQTKVKFANTKLRRWRGRVRDLQRYTQIAALQAPAPKDGS